MKKMYLFMLVLLLIVSSGCSRTSSTYSKAEDTSGTVVYKDTHLRIVRVEINGVNYLASSVGGIIREGAGRP